MRDRFGQLGILLGLACLLVAARAGATQSFDLVLRGGRVIDPETQLDAVRNVGIRDGVVQAVTAESLEGRETLDVRGLVVAPGFIDTHSHAQTPSGQTYQVRDGVTTALELEAGVHPFPGTQQQLEGVALIHYGASANYLFAREQVKGSTEAAVGERATSEEVTRALAKLEADLDRGALGIGLLLDYMSEAVDASELRKIFELGARRRQLIFIHMRRPARAGDPAGLSEVLELARATGAAIQICHIGSNAIGGIATFLEMIRSARAKGVDVSAETYPYTAGSTYIGAAVFGRDWQTAYGTTWADVEWPPTGERFSETTWKEYRAKFRDDRNALIIHHFNREEWLEQSLRDPLVMIASDAVPTRSLEERAHPRSMGTFARVLGVYVRERGVLTLSEAIRKMTLMPAQRLERLTPEMARKGRIQPGSDADITIFDPNTVNDRATFKEPNQFSAGIAHVLVGGSFVVRDGANVAGVHPGKPVLSGSTVD
ncbi:MAG: amidohydrolase family protein [Deltaproteobacteria bacterium]|nr:amidohydrolase family protein [Deltaproteobacteria bacterium]MBW2361533.1 amidohydrolase family protein [Deltaproteobacteria bacterium]